MKLSLYLARRFIVSVLMVGGVFAGILMLIDMVEQIRRYSGNADVGLGQIAMISGLNIAGGLYRILPLVVMLGAVTMFLNLARSSELVVIRAAGRSAIRAALAPAVTALLLGCGIIALMNPLVAATARAADDLASRLARDGSQSVLSVDAEGLWLRQGSTEGQTVIRAGRANMDGTLLMNVTFLTFAPDGLPVTRIQAREAALTRGNWTLQEAKIWNLDRPNPEVEAEALPSMSLPTDLTADKIRESFSAPDAVSIWDLPGFISSLERAGFSAQKHRVWLQRELALPLTLAAMVLLAAGFTMRHSRAGGTGVKVLMAVLAGFSVFFLRNFAQVLGENGQIPVMAAAWTIPFATLLAALGLLLHLEDG